MKKLRLSVVVLLTASILMGCIPSRATGFSVFLLADQTPATELSVLNLDDIELREEPILSGDGHHYVLEEETRNGTDRRGL